MRHYTAYNVAKFATKIANYCRITKENHKMLRSIRFDSNKKTHFLHGPSSYEYNILALNYLRGRVETS